MQVLCIVSMVKTILGVTDGGKPMLTVTNLIPQTVYTLRLSAGNEVGFGEWVEFRVKTLSEEMSQQSGLTLTIYSNLADLCVLIVRDMF